MASLFSEGFEGGANGAAITTSNTVFSWISASAELEFDGDDPLVGDLCMSIPEVGYGSVTVEPLTTIYLKAYVKFGTLGSPIWFMNVLDDTPSTLATLRVSSDRTLRVMPGTSGTILETTAALTAGEWARVEWAITGTTMQLRVFLGANVHGTIPDEESPVTAWDGGTIAMVQVGDIAATGLGVFMDDFAADDTTWVGSSVNQLEAPGNLTLTAAEGEPGFTVSWSAVDGAGTYDVQTERWDGDEWTDRYSITVATTSLTRTEAQGILPGTRYRARVRAVPVA